MKIVTLRTGHRVSDSLVNAVMKSLRFLTDTHEDMNKGANLSEVFSFYEAVAKARDASYEVPSERRMKLEVYHLLDGKGSMHEGVALVIRAAVVGEGIAMSIQNPLEEQSEVPLPTSTHDCTTRILDPDYSDAFKARFDAHDARGQEAPDVASEESDIGTEPDPHRT